LDDIKNTPYSKQHCNVITEREEEDTTLVHVQSSIDSSSKLEIWTDGQGDFYIAP